MLITFFTPNNYCNDESFYFLSPWKMIESGNWLIPFFEGLPRLQKPPLYYWLVAISYKIFGISMFSARIVTVIFSLLTLFLIFKFTYLLTKNKLTAWLSLFLLFSNVTFFFTIRFALLDMALTFFITLSIYFFLKGYNKEKKRTFYLRLCWIAMALAVMVKGPVGFLIPFFTCFFFILIKSKENILYYLQFFLSPISILLFLLIVLPWPIYMYRQYGNIYLSHIIGTETSGRINVNILDILSRFVRYFSLLFWILFPWSIFWITNFISKKDTTSIIKRIRQNNEASILIAIWSLAILIPFIGFISHTCERYLLPLTPPFCIITAIYLSSLKDFNPFQSKLFKVNLIVILTGFIILTGVLLLLTRLNFFFYGLRMYFLATVIALLLTGTYLYIRSFYQKKYFRLISITISMSILLLFTLFDFVNPSLRFNHTKEIAKYIKGKKDKLTTIGLCQNERTHLSMYSLKHLDRWFESDQIKSGFKYLIDNFDKNLGIVVLEKYDFFKMPEKLQKRFKILGESYTIKHISTERPILDILDGSINNKIAESKIYYYVLSDKKGRYRKN